MLAGQARNGQTEPGGSHSEDGDKVEPEAVSNIVEHLDDDRVEHVRVLNCDVCHNVHQHMLMFHGPGLSEKLYLIPFRP